MDEYLVLTTEQISS